MGTYDVYKNRVSAYGATIREGRINTITNKINNSFTDSPSYFDVTFNDDSETTGVHIMDDATAINNTNQYSKIIVMQPEAKLQVGDVITWNTVKWLCVACEMVGEIYFHGKIVKCNHSLTVYKNGISSQVPACVDNGVRFYQMGVDETRLVRVPEGVTVLRVQDNATTALIQRGEVFAIGRENYEVIDTNSVIEPGLLVLKMEFTTRSPEVIPDPKPVQDIVIEGAESILRGKSAVYTTDYEEPVVFTITGTFATITAQANNSCTVKAGDNFGEVTLTATAGEVSGTKKIKVTALF